MSGTVTRVRARFEKGEEVRFISHLDLAHAMERAARRANLPLAFSEGFHPMPKISFAAALAVGATSEAEYVDLELACALSAQQVSQSLNAVLPPGLKIREAALLPPEAKALQAVVNLATYRVGPRFAVDVPAACLAAETEALRARDTLLSRRSGPKEEKVVDIRPFLVSAVVSASDEAPELEMAIRLGAGGSAKPEEYLSFLSWPLERVRVHRTGLFVERGGELLSPLNVVR